MALPAEPASVPLARTWVADVLADLGRDDLVFTAQLAVSELVTNAILHAAPPVTVHLDGTVERPRIEVVDHTSGPLRPTALAIVDTEDLPTFGRGLALVALNSAAWGFDELPDGSGKRVWFEPAAEVRDVDDLELDDLFADVDLGSGAHLETPRDSVRVSLTRMPVPLYVAMRRYHFELRREMRLLALSDPGRYTIAAKLTDAFADADAVRHLSTGVSTLDDAVNLGASTIDLEYAVPNTAPDVMSRLLPLLESCRDGSAPDQHLLAMVPSLEVARFQEWYLGEFVRQGRGEAPSAWTGPIAEPSTDASSAC